MPHQVPNPYFSPSHPESSSNPRKIAAALSHHSTDAITSLRHRDLLGDAEYLAALRFQHLLLTLEGGSLRSLDPGRPIVDFGSRPSNGFGDREARAGKGLRECRDLLGERQFQLLRLVCGWGFGLGTLPGYDDSKRTRLFLAELLRVSLGDLSNRWGLSR